MKKENRQSDASAENHVSAAASSTAKASRKRKSVAPANQVPQEAAAVTIEQDIVEGLGLSQDCCDELENVLDL